MPDERIVLRHFPGNPIFDVKRYPKSLAFSPDIVPQYGHSPLVDELTNDLAFGSFIALPLVYHDDNLIFVRGITSPDTSSYFTAAITMRAIASELILWPQIWNQTTPIAPGPLFIKPGKDYWFERVATDAAFIFRPSYTGGLGYSLIAHHVSLSANLDTSQRSRDLIPSPPANINNCKDYYKFVTSDTTTTYYNVLVADPTVPVISITTRLRIFDDNPSNVVTLWLSVWHAGVPKDTQISLSSDCGQVHIPKRGISNSSAGVGKLEVKAGYDGHISMNIFRPDGEHFDPYSWMSLRVGMKPDVPGPYEFLGAQNIVFEADSTRNIRFASPAAVNIRNNHPSPPTAGGDVTEPAPVLAPTPTPTPAAAPEPPKDVRPPLVPTFPVATGWWFRSDMNDTNWFPRSTANGAIFYESPDIQSVGHTPIDSSILLNPATNYTNVLLSSDSNNYIYVRGHCTLPNITVEARLFFFPSSALLHPSFYTMEQKYCAKDEDGSIAIRTLTTTPGTDFYVFDKPFNIHSVPNPKEYGADHYCMIAEVRQKTSEHDDPHWPHEAHEEFNASASDFTPWMSTQSCVCWKNVSWTPCSVHITIIVKIILPPACSCSTCWTIIIESFGAPPGSYWQLSQIDGPSIPGLTIGFEKRALNTANSLWGCHFTGVPAGYEGTLQFEWISGNGQPAPSDMYFNYHLGCYSPNAASPAGSLTYPAIHGNDQWPFYVGDQYPNLSSCQNPPLVPRFEKPGLNPWPYATSTWSRIGGNKWNISS
ncbi:hypothetical protein BDQ17DRAFT_1423981 [Cyathus striatus]|nr:hypothetical protein BDQ17DRAFT_1423981 [Cyathus striatus]